MSTQARQREDEVLPRLRGHTRIHSYPLYSDTIRKGFSGLVIRPEKIISFFRTIVRTDLDEWLKIF